MSLSVVLLCNFVLSLSFLCSCCDEYSEVLTALSAITGFCISVQYCHFLHSV